MFSLSLENCADLVEVAAFRGKEAIGKVARMDVDVVFDADPRSIENTFIGQRAILHIDNRRHDARRIAGTISRARWLGSLSHGAQRFRLRMTSKLARLQLARNTRIFQDTSAVSVLHEILEFHAIRHRFALQTERASRVYCVQYRETDLEFMRRLLAEEGLFYFIEDPVAGSMDETVVITDNVHAYASILGSPLVFREQADGMMPDENHVRGIVHEQRAVVEQVRIRSYDPARPSVIATSDHRSGPGKPDEYTKSTYHYHDEDMSPGGPARPTVTPWPRAETFLDQLRRNERTVVGQTPCVRLFPGGVIGIQEQDADNFDGSYVIRTLHHDGVDPRSAGAREPYLAKFEAMPRMKVVRSKPPQRRLVQVAETARVVGPPGAQEGEIHTDRWGRVEVQFPWDDLSRPSSRSSCWIRTVQAWSGAGFGTQFIPRVGMEVLVVFLGGDPDRPVVVGALPNAEHLPPFELPGGAAKSGIRTQSIGGAGFNELSFVDTPGDESVRLHGQNQIDVVAEGNVAITTGKIRTDVTYGAHISNVGGDAHQSFSRDRNVEIMGSDKLDVHGSREIDVQEQIAIHAGHGVSIETEGTFSTRTDGMVSVDAGTDVSIRSGPGNGVLQLSAGGSLFAQSNHDIAIHAAERITLSVGNTRLEITSDGIKLDGTELVVDAKKSLIAKGPGPSMTLDKRATILSQQITLLSAGAEVSLGAEAELKAAKIKFGHPSKLPTSDSTSQAAEKRPFRIKVTDYDFEPYADKHFELVAHGERIEGTTSIDGEIDVEISADTKVVDLKVWIDLYPEGRTRQWLAQIEDLADIGSPRGALERLTNLGYYGGPPGDELGSGGRAALIWFQNDHELAPTGELDGKTKQKLAEVHGD